MKDISRRKAIAKIAGGSAGQALMSLNGHVLLSGRELGETIVQGSTTAQAITARAFSGQHQPQPAPL